MKAQTLALAAILLVSCTLVLSAVPVWAKKPVEMNIVVTPLGPPISFTMDELPNGLMKISFTVQQTWSGDWDGINEQSGTAIGRSEDIGNLLSTVQAAGVFTGTVHGPDGDRTGTIRHRMLNNISPSKGYFANRITILGGTGDLAGIHGQGTVGDGWITINVHFDPS
jgi:hypothetical protein